MCLCVFVSSFALTLLTCSSVSNEWHDEREEHDVSNILSTISGQLQEPVSKVSLDASMLQ